MIVIIVCFAVVSGLILEGASMILKKHCIHSKFNLQRKEIEEEELDKPVTKRDLMNMLKEIEKRGTIDNLNTSSETIVVYDTKKELPLKDIF